MTMRYYLFFVLCLFFSIIGINGRMRGVVGKNFNNDTKSFRITVFHELVLQHTGNISKIEHTVSIPIVDGVESSTFYSINLPDDVMASHSESIKSGRLFISATGVHTHDGKVVLTKNSSVSVLNGSLFPHRELKKSSVRKVAVVRISMGAGDYSSRRVSYSSKEIAQHIFEDDNVSLAKQVERCSGGKVKIQSGGVYEVTVPGKVSDYKSPASLRNKALEVLSKQKKVKAANELADHVMVILPPNNFPDFVGNAGVNHWLSTLNDEWSLDVTVYMHELGYVERG